MAEEAKRGGGLQRLVLWLVIAALLAAVAYLAAERNERHWRTTAANGQVMIERGHFFPTGSGPVADKIYAPLPVPAGEKAPGEMEFDDQNALDRYLFGLLGAWAKDSIKKGDTRTAAALVERASALPGLTGEQFAELAATRADLAWDDAQADVAKAVQLLEAARRKLEAAKQTNGAHATEAAALQAKLQSTAADLAAAAGKH